MIGSSRLLVLRLLLRSLNLLVGLVQALTRVVDEAVSSSSSRSDQVAAKRGMVSPPTESFALPTRADDVYMGAGSSGRPRFRASSLFFSSECNPANARQTV